MPISCHFRDCKVLLVASLTHVSGAITSILTFTFTLYLYQHTIRFVMFIGFIRDGNCLIQRERVSVDA